MSDTESSTTIQKAVIVPYMPKGGVGKTTTTAHLGYALSEYGKTLVIDADPQGNLTNHLLCLNNFLEQDRSLVKYLNREASFTDSIIEARSPNATYKGLYLLGTSSNSLDLNNYIANKFPSNPVHIKLLVKEAMKNGFTFILIDPPASFGLYTRYLLASATHVIPIVEPEKFGFESIFTLMPELKEIKEGFDVNFDNKIAIINKLDPKNATNKFFLEKMQSSPFTLFVIKESKAIPFACTKSLLLQEYKPDNPVNAVFSEIAAYYKTVLIK